MSNRSKKIIAREFLALVAMFIISGIIYLCIIPYNSYYDNKIENINFKIEAEFAKSKEIASSAKSKIEKQKWYHSEITNEFENLSDKYKQISTLWPSLQSLAENDSLESKYSGKWSQRAIDFHKKIGFKTSKDFQNFILTNSLSKNDSLELKKNEILLNDIESLKIKKNNYEVDKFDEHEQIEFTSKALLFLFIIMFLLRYLIYAIKWSIRILKT